MLIRFTVDHLGPISNTATLSLVAIDHTPNVLQPTTMTETLVRTAAIYGPNNSGKTLILGALAWLRNTACAPLEHTPTPPALTNDQPVQFTLDIAVDGVRFEYLLEWTRGHVTYEALHHYPQHRRRKIFERSTDDGLTFQSGLGSSLGAVRKLITPHRSLLPLVRAFNEPLTTSFLQALDAITLSGAHTTRTNAATQELSAPASAFQPSSPHAHQALALARLADPTISAINAIEQAGHTTLTITNTYDTHTHNTMFEELSTGLRAWVALAANAARVLGEGGVLVCDDMDAHVHPAVLARLIRVFQSAQENPKGGQLVFAAHNTALLRELGRDQVWFTQRDAAGGIVLGALSDFAGGRVRRSMNVEASYLAGRFGALPAVDDVDVLAV